MIEEINAKEASDFLLPRHYSGRIPTISTAFGWREREQLKAVCTFGKPASPSLADGICGRAWSANVYELNRLCREEDFEEPLSKFVSACLRKLKDRDWIIVSYSDTQMNHHGYIYQACNFLYTGMTKERTDIWTGTGKHPRHYTDAERDYDIRQVRSAKHRYVYFCTRSKALRQEWESALKYPILPYPKGDNSNYTLGHYIKQKLINKRTGREVGWEREPCETVSMWLDRLLG